MVLRDHEAGLLSLQIISLCHLLCGLPGHPTLHPMNKSVLVVHNRAPLLPKKGEGLCIPPLTSCLQHIIKQYLLLITCFHQPSMRLDTSP